MSWLFYNTSGQVKQGNSSLGTDIPVGGIIPCARTTIPAGWLRCDGSAVSRTTYSDLFGEIGTTYGAGNGSTTFNLPDLRGRVAVGKADSGTFLNMNSPGGAETVALTAAQSGVPAHSHPNWATSGNDNTDHSHSGGTGGASANHTHTVQHTQIGNTEIGGIGQRVTTMDGGANAHTSSGQSNDHGHSFTTGGRSAFHQHAITVNNENNTAANAASAHANLQPYVVTQYIIKALNVVAADLGVGMDNLTDVVTSGAADRDQLAYDTTNQNWTPQPSSVPIGVVLDFYGNALPAGFLWCDGSAIPGQYAEAISIIGANTPDLRGRVTAGLDNIGGVDAGRLSIANTLGTTTGSQTHTLTAAELASHAHAQQGSFVSGGISANHTHGVTVSGSGGFHWNQGTQHDTSVGAGNNFVTGIQTGSVGANSIHQPVGFTSTGGTGTVSSDHTHTTTISGNTTNAGSGSAHNNMQPTMVVNKIIRVL